ncbi:MAG: YqeG family HAD IIIA-type phosphatase [Candidatus Altiarchaeota archaeon]
MSARIFWSYLNPLFFMDYANPRMLRPDLRVDSISEIDAEKLRDKKIRSLIFDVDNTLCEYHGKGVDSSLKEKVEELNVVFNCCILSNTSSETRVEELKKYFNLPIAETLIKKPKREAFHAALKLLKTKPAETAMIGDRLLTDIAGANKIGIYSIKVKPLHPETEPTGLWIGRVFETILFRIYKIFGLY